MAKVNWEERFNVLKNANYKYSDTKEWRFALEEDKTKGTLQINARCWTIGEGENAYNGPSKNGFIIPITSSEDFDNIVKCFKEFADFADSCKEFV